MLDAGTRVRTVQNPKLDTHFFDEGILVRRKFSGEQGVIARHGDCTSTFLVKYACGGHAWWFSEELSVMPSATSD